MRLPRSSHCTMLETSCDARAHTSAPSTGCSVPVAAAAAPLAARWALSNACTAPAKSSFRSCATSALRSARLSFAQCATRCLWSYSLRIFWTSLGGASPPLPYGGSSAPGSSTRGSTTRRATTIATAAPAAAPAARAARRSALAPLHSALARPHHAGPPIASRETPPGDDPTPRCGTPPPSMLRSRGRGAAISRARGAPGAPATQPTKPVQPPRIDFDLKHLSPVGTHRPVAKPDLQAITRSTTCAREPGTPTGPAGRRSRVPSCARLQPGQGGRTNQV